MKDNRITSRILEMVRKRIKESNDIERLHDIASAIGDRRSRDLVDYLALIDQEEGWSTALHLLVKSKDSKYSSPTFHFAGTRMVEPLKYREVVFDILGCRGFEPVESETLKLLETLESVSSIAEAQRTFTDMVQREAENQVQHGDSLFFEVESMKASDGGGNLWEAVDKIRRKEVDSLRITQSEKLNIEQLWFCEYGRQALAELGISGLIVDRPTLDTVLSVIPISHDVFKHPDRPTFTEELRLHRKPRNLLYRSLQFSMIDCDLATLTSLGSRYSEPFIMTQCAIACDKYIASPSSENYRKFLSMLDNIILIREPNSIRLLEQLSHQTDFRLVTPSVAALSNYYNETSLSVLCELGCTTKRTEILKLAISAIEKLHTKKPYLVFAFRDLLHSDCRNSNPLRKLYARLAKRGTYLH